MVFSSILFLYYFLGIIFICYYLLPDRFKNGLFLFVSLLFYAWGEPVFIFVLLASLVLNYFVGVMLDKGVHTKLWLAAGCGANLLILGVFKYSNFFVENVNAVLSTNIDIPTVALPLGISFFTFQSISYVVDVYRKHAPAQKKFLNLALYITAFPQLVAGPIVRYTTMAHQIEHRICNSRKAADGIVRFTIGLSKKVLISNPMGLLVDELLLDGSFSFAVATGWIGIAAYTIQIYFDFSGYSDMAIGLGKMFGFEFQENFNYPYISASVSEFWRRWHISLGSFFRDYLYIPLGGNRVSKWKNVRNLMIVWFLTGMWHGAEWTFIVWGVYYGVLIILEKNGLLKFMERLPMSVRRCYTMLCVMIGWVFFRMTSVREACVYLGILFGFSQNKIWDSDAALLLHDNWPVFCAAIIGATPVVSRCAKRLFRFDDQARSTARAAAMSAGTLILLGLCTVYLVNSTYNPFIYFKF